MQRQHCRVLLLLFALLGTSGPAGASGLVGIWSTTVGNQTVELRLEADGQGQFNGSPLRYQTVGSLLLVQDAGGGLQTYAYAVDGPQLTLAGGDIEGTLVLRRGPAAAPSASAAAPRAPAASASSGQELVGRWCHVSSFTANQGGGSQSSRCFELTADGRYQYQGEGSVSAYGGGLYGATSSSSRDSGRWSLQGDQLVAQSDSGQVQRYRLEKRNHPRNRDPMICLDGDCYATYWNRPPW